MLIGGSLWLAIIINSAYFSQYIIDPRRPIVSFILPLCFLFLFSILFFLVKRGYTAFASLGFIAVYVVLACSSLVKWGVDLPLGLLSLALVIVVSGVVITARFALLLTGAISIFLLLDTYLQISKIVPANTAWRSQSAGFGSTIVYLATLFVISAVAWLFNREIEKSLKRAQESENALRQERDTLEERVHIRTEELRNVQYQRALEMHRFADFGRHAYGLIHDLINPLTAHSIQLERLHATSHSKELKEAIAATKRMEQFVLAVRKQFANEEQEIAFAPADEINNVLKVVTYKARRAQVRIVDESDQTVQLYSSPVRIYKVTLNLLSNAIDSFAEITDKRHRAVTISCREVKKQCVLTIKDNGIGIPAELLVRIFDPFFTTKGLDQGTGIGLTICKEIIEKELCGSIEVQSKEGEGSLFSVYLPITAEP